MEERPQERNDGKIIERDIEKRKAMIRQKANEMGYLPNMAARALKTKMTHNIGVLFIDDYHSGLTHPYFALVR